MKLCEEEFTIIISAEVNRHYVNNINNYIRLQIVNILGPVCLKLYT